ncbi:5-methyltetrahydropteroyltriglutamate--homocysteine S-methyltransferase [Peribacillus frigoritolerans]|uniref:5-methyltetrahydropteroyltriglutamate--homocysteine methyltransferase n=1 Tax=Peribacillus frigoritolerans TaxID=450367 RepID=A0AAJ1QJP3_9BACI|nr:5-methyltetrahydropteroyltriglutamate--homocysteine S-methyltransferase [Peribacillus frigoritolerans]MDM5282656.1 5-methyltetrahydropteroyltriglutamate--homocysteine S-methyltransferase [Peribacillus frigoritolerans]
MGILKSSTLGYPRIGEDREWKRTLEAYWSGKIDEAELTAQLKAIRLGNIQKQKQQGIDIIPVNDFTFYDQMLDMSVMFGLVPERYSAYEGGSVPLSVYYSMARGNNDEVASEMTKWFNTNYHYIVPELKLAQLTLTENKPLTAYREAKEKLGIETKPVLIGPYTFLSLSKGFNKEEIPGIILSLLPLYTQILRELEQEGVKWVQMDEPSLVSSISKDDMQTVTYIYEKLNEAAPNLNIMLQTYFDAVEHYQEVIELQVQGIGLDFVHDKGRNLSNLEAFGFPKDKVLAAGVIDGKNIWLSDLSKKIELIETLKKQVAEDQIWLQPSCSLLHVPVTVRNETALSKEVKEALAFADEKLEEITLLVKGNNQGIEAIAEKVDANIFTIQTLANSNVRNHGSVQSNVEKVKTKTAGRQLPFKDRYQKQQEFFKLPFLPSTTIGSFPQTFEVKQARGKFNRGEWTAQQYESFVNEEIGRWIEIQEEIGLDVLVHGEFERTDMVEYFGHKLGGFVFLEKGWVQSYGSRCVKPPVIYGDIHFIEPMTVRESVYAQSLTKKTVKGMLTGPVTILNWSFVRDDISRENVCYQLALALEKEVISLESAGIKMIQVDEPALREGLPLKKSDRDEYLNWAVNSFLISTSSVEDTTQIHTHMCYCDFNSFMDVISSLDADVISIETSRSHGELASAFEEKTYEKGIGLGVYDIHSPRVPAVEEMVDMIERGIKVLDKDQFWINPDCGLKTRGIPETVASLKNMVEAAKIVRENLLVNQQAND